MALTLGYGRSLIVVGAFGFVASTISSYYTVVVVVFVGLQQ